MNTENPQPDPQKLQILPNSSTVLILGILSIFLFCFSAGTLSLAMGVIALILANQSAKMYRETPRMYTPESYKNLSTGRTCAIIGIILSAMIVLFVILMILFGVGMALSTIPFCM